MANRFSNGPKAEIVPLLASTGGLLLPPRALLFFFVYSIFASSLPQLWSLLVNITGWPVPVWTSNPAWPFSALLKTPACWWHLVGTPAAADWRRAELSDLARLIWRSHPWHLASSLFCSGHPAPFQEVSSRRRSLISRACHWPQACHTRSLFLRNSLFSF